MTGSRLGSTCGYTIIKDYMRECEQRRKEVFVPLAHPPGHGQAGFGEAMLVIGGVEQKTHFFVLDLPHSDGCYVRAYPAAVAEDWVVGHVHAFAFFGAVPQSIVYDNDRCLFAKILPDRVARTEKLTPRIAAIKGTSKNYRFPAHWVRIARSDG